MPSDGQRRAVIRRSHALGLLAERHAEPDPDSQPHAEGLFAFTIEVRDQTGARDTGLSSSPGRIPGTPTARGTFSFLVRVTDSRGAFAERTFS